MSATANSSRAPTPGSARRCSRPDPTARSTSPTCIASCSSIPSGSRRKRRARLDLRAGDDKGRIYRVVPEKKSRRAIPNLAARDAAALVQSLRSVNGWERTTAQRLLVERRDTSAVPLLGEIVRTALEPKARMHALCTLEGVGAITAEDVVAGARDSHAAVREHAVRLAEPFLEKNVEKVHDALASLVDDPEIRYRYQLVFSLGAAPRKERAKLLARIALRDGNVAQIRTAIISSASGQTIELLERLLSGSTGELEPELPSTLFRMLAKEPNLRALMHILAQLESVAKSKPAPWHFVAAAAFLDGLNQQKRSIEQLRQLKKDAVSPKRSTNSSDALAKRSSQLPRIDPARSLSPPSRFSEEIRGIARTICACSEISSNRNRREKCKPPPFSD